MKYIQYIFAITFFFAFSFFFETFCELTRNDVETILFSQEPLTQELYNLFSEKNKTYIETVCNHTSLAKYRALTPTDRYPLRNQITLDLLLELGDSLRKRYPKDIIISLGQSPAWITQAAQFLDKNPSRFIFVAFSGKWFEHKLCQLYRSNWAENITLDLEKISSFFSFHSYKEKKQTPNNRQIRAYREYLETLGLSPRKIVAAHKYHEKKTVIAERVFYGNSLVSFLHVLLDWAKEEHLLLETKKALSLHLFFTEDIFKSTIFYPDSEEKIEAYIPKLSIDKRRLIKQLSNISDKYDDRVVPFYPFILWSTRNTPKLTATRKTNLIRFRILDAIEKFLLNRI